MSRIWKSYAGWIVAGALTGALIGGTHPPSLAARWTFTPGVGTVDNPRADDGRVLVTFHAESESFLPTVHLYALDIATGRQQWHRSVELTGQFAVTGGRVYFMASDKSVHSLDAASGKDLWRSAPGFALLEATANDVYVLDAGQRLATLDPATGKLVRQTDIQGSDLTRLQIDHGRVYVSGQTLQVFDAETLKPVWQSSIHAPALQVLANLNRVYVHDADTLHALDSVSGKEVWAYRTGSPAQAEDGGLLYFTTNVVNTLEAATGVVRGQFPIANYKFAAFGSLTVWNGRIYGVASRPHGLLSGFSGAADNALCVLDAATGRTQSCSEWRYEYLHAPVRYGQTVFAGSAGEGGRPASLYAFSAS